MKRPDFVDNDMITRWGDALDKDGMVPEFFKKTDLLREIMFAGFWLLEELTRLKCESDTIVRIQFTHGSMSYGNDTWKVAEDLLTAYKAGELEFVDEEAIGNQVEAIKKFDVPRDAKTQN
jgi:hypothetical protein